MAKASTDVKSLHIRAAGLSDAGCVRERNEDAFLVDEENGVFIVADGVGGHARGDVASRMVVEVLPQIIRKRISEMRAPKASNDRAIGEMLQESVNELSRKMHAGSEDDPACKGMGATAVAVLLTARHAHIAHMGDSRAYLFRRGRLRKLTEDHSIVNLLMHNGEITAREAKDHPARGRLTRFVGMEAEVDPGIQALQLQAGDRLLLCTDGLWGTVSHQQLREILAEGNDPEITCRALLAAGKEAGGKDNLTAVVVDAYEVDVSKGELIYHEFPPPRRLWKVMKADHARDLIEKGVFFLSNVKRYRQEPPGPRRDESDGVLKYGWGGSWVTVHSGNELHAWCATTEDDVRKLFGQWRDYDTVVQITDCAELFRRAKVAACQGGDCSEIRAGYARYDRGAVRTAWPEWGHGYVQKDASEHGDQKEYRFVLVMNYGEPYLDAIELQVGDCRDIITVVARRAGMPDETR